MIIKSSESANANIQDDKNYKLHTNDLLLISIISEIP